MAINIYVLLSALLAGMLRSIIGKLETGADFDYDLLIGG